MQGAPFDSPTAAYFKSISTADVVSTPRNTVAIRRPDGSEWAVEELVAMQLGYVRELAEAAAGARVTDTIVTVPAFYTQHERAAMVAAIELAGLRAAGLVHDGTAVAVNYAMTRQFPAAGEEPEYHVIYDAGASAIRATVAAFSGLPKEAKDTKDTKDTGGKTGGGKKEAQGAAIAIRGFGFDRSVGGVELDRRLREMLADDFGRRHQRDVRADARGMAKLWKEAGRVKAILSANADALASVRCLAIVQRLGRLC